MPKITKHAEFLDTLRTMVTKEATASTGTASGKPGAETHYTSVSKETETVNKNEQGHPEHNPQEVTQKPAKDKSDPTKKHSEELEAEKVAKDAAVAAKAALPDTGKPEVAKDAPAKVEQKAAEAKPEENLKLAELGKQLLDTIKQIQTEQVKEATASTGTASGKPGVETHYESVSKETETVNKNEQGHPEHNPQAVTQKPAKDKSDPTKKHSAEVSQEELDKQASFELGRQFCRSFLQTKVASQTEVYKEAGRKDFEQLIAQAAAELEQEQGGARQEKQASAVYDEQQAEKLAEEQGAQAFYSMMKQAQEEYQAEQVKTAFNQKVQAIINEKTAAEKRAQELEAALAAKEAALQEREAAMQKKAEEEKRAQEFHTWGNYVVNEMLDRLRSESVKP